MSPGRALPLRVPCLRAAGEERECGFHSGLALEAGGEGAGAHRKCLVLPGRDVGRDSRAHTAWEGTGNVFSSARPCLPYLWVLGCVSPPGGWLAWLVQEKQWAASSTSFLSYACLSLICLLLCCGSAFWWTSPAILRSAQLCLTWSGAGTGSQPRECVTSPCTRDREELCARLGTLKSKGRPMDSRTCFTLRPSAWIAPAPEGAHGLGGMIPRASPCSGCPAGCPRLFLV